MKLASFTSSTLSLLLLAQSALCKKNGGSFGSSSYSSSSTSVNLASGKGSGQGGCYFGDYEVDVSNSCCSAWGRLYSASNRTLDKKFAACENEVLETMLVDLPAYCDANVTECHIDYNDFSCDEEYIATCTSVGGVLVEFDETSVCSLTDGGVLTTHSLDKATCVPKVCTTDEILSLLAVPALIEGGSGTCEVDGMGNITINGFNIWAYAPQSQEEGGGVNGAVVGLVIVVICVLVCGFYCVASRYKRSRELDQELPDVTAQKEAQYVTTSGEPAKEELIRPDCTQSSVSEPSGMHEHIVEI